MPVIETYIQMGKVQDARATLDEAYRKLLDTVAKSSVTSEATQAARAAYDKALATYKAALGN